LDWLKGFDSWSGPFNLFFGSQDSNIYCRYIIISSFGLIVKSKITYLWIFMINWADKLKKIRLSSGLSQQKWADKIGIPQKTWSNYENGRTAPKMDIFFTLREKGYTIKGLTSDPIDDWPEEMKKESPDRMGLLKAGAFSLEMSSDAAGQYLDRVSDFSLFKFSYGKPVPVPTQETDPNAMVLLPVFSQRVAAGQGQPPSQLVEIEAYIPIVLEMLGGAHPRNCGIVRIVGDSMTDMTLFNGDYVIFDRSQLEGDGVYVISIGADVRVKRVEYRPFEQKIIIRSENAKRYPEPEIISYEQAEKMLLVHGKVICWLHKHPY
jgi:SOS-response transcriptional repressor LexA